jgi:hypothetical protein
LRFYSVKAELRKNGVASGDVVYQAIYREDEHEIQRNKGLSVKLAGGGFLLPIAPNP